jgi:hypothetical protein
MKLEPSAAAVLVTKEHKADDEIKESEQRPGRSVRGFLRMDHKQYGSRDSQKKHGDAESKPERHAAGHPAIGVSVDVEMRGHAQGKLVPDLPVAQGEERQS